MANQPRRPGMSGAICLAACLLAFPANAASQGTIGATSSGGVRISVSIPAPARVSGLSDVEFGGAGASAATGIARDFCFTGAAGAYTVTATGSGPGGLLSLSNGDERVAYRVEWLSRSEAPLGETFSMGGSMMIEAAARQSDCGQAPSSGRLMIALEPADAEKLLAGAAYTGVLVLMLSPQ